MKRRLSSRLSPQAKKAAMQSSQQPVTGILEVASGAAAAVERAIMSMGGKVRSAVEETNSISFEIGADRLAELADVEGVVYVAMGDAYRP